jgi:hypothetical protein
MSPSPGLTRPLQSTLSLYRKSVEKLEKRLQGEAVLEKNLMIPVLARRTQADLPAVP